MKLLKKFVAFIEKDVANDNEAKRLAVLIRGYSLIFVIYLVIETIILFCWGNAHAGIMSSVSCGIYLLIFAASYANHNVQLRFCTIFITVCWAICFLVHLGWSSGAQQFLPVLVVFIFVTGMERISIKIVGAFSLCIVRMLLYYYTQHNAPVFIITDQASFGLQTLNSIVIFSEMIFLISTFSRESNAMEAKLLKYNEKIHKMASTDPLTKLMNRRSMVEYMQKQINSYDRGELQQFSIAIGDIDFFKKVNDTYGHEAGDDVLKAVASCIESTIHGNGKVARWGGEEFLLLFRDLNGDQARIELEKVRETIEKLVVNSADLTIQVTMTFGLEEYDNYEGVDRIISKADEKLYMGKESGRNKVVY